jgi:hypothetical protein
MNLVPALEEEENTGIKLTVIGVRFVYYLCNEVI